jgi:hypothetical protein
MFRTSTFKTIQQFQQKRKYFKKIKHNITPIAIATIFLGVFTLPFLQYTKNRKFVKILILKKSEIKKKFLNEKKVSLYIATSIDGFIADKNGDIGFLKDESPIPVDYGYSLFYSNIDAIVMGGNTYRQGEEFLL